MLFLFHGCKNSDSIGWLGEGTRFLLKDVVAQANLSTINEVVNGNYSCNIQLYIDVRNIGERNGTIKSWEFRIFSKQNLLAAISRDNFRNFNFQDEGSNFVFLNSWGGLHLVTISPKEGWFFKAPAYPPGIDGQPDRVEAAIQIQADDGRMFTLHKESAFQVIYMGPAREMEKIR